MSTLLAASSTPKTFWYLTRGSGVVALLLLTAALVLGVLSSVRWRGDRSPRFLVNGLHKNITLTAIVFVVIHVVTTILDGYAPIGLKDAVIPFASKYRPIWLGLGAVAFDLLLALVVTSLLRARIGLRTWRAVHWFAYASWPVALMHALGTGSDARFGWLALTAFGSCALVVIAVFVRLARATPAAAVRIAAGTAAVILPLLVFVWYRSGPLQHGWAARAGTPASLLRTASAKVAADAAVTKTAAAPVRRFDARLAGRLTETRPNAQGIVAVAISGRVLGAVTGTLNVTLYGVPTEAGGVEMTSSRVVFARAGSTVLEGSVVQLEGTHVIASLADASGARTNLALQLNVDQSTGQVSGSVRGTSA